MIPALKDAKAKVIGIRETTRALQRNQVSMVLFAADIEGHLLRKIAALCLEKQVPLVPAKINQQELGQMCQIEVGAAVVGIFK